MDDLLGPQCTWPREDCHLQVTRRCFLQMIDLSKRFGDRVAVRDLTLGVPCGSILALLGPSGSGKTTTLRLLAGFETPDAGKVMVDDLEVTGLPPVKRQFGMVFQHYALFPHLNVGENVAFGLTARGTSGEQRKQRVAEVLALVDLAGFEERKVAELSGGQQQRVAVARALAPEPTVLLLDEPLSNLDPSLRERTRRELRTVLVKTGVTTVFVTHEQEEAFAMADRIAILHEGRLEQIGTAQDLYDDVRRDVRRARQHVAGGHVGGGTRAPRLGVRVDGVFADAAGSGGQGAGGGPARGALLRYR